MARIPWDTERGGVGGAWPSSTAGQVQTGGAGAGGALPSCPSTGMGEGQESLSLS